MPQREPSETRILTVAGEHLRKFGLKRFTVVAVAEEAGMTHANVYRYFPSKGALIDAVVDVWLKATERRLADVADGPDPADDKLERLILALAKANRDLLTEEPHLFAALSLAVDPQGGSLPVNWDNPASKRKGSFTAAGNMVLVENSICRPFTATVLAPGAAREIRYRGEACRVGPGDWALKSAEPLVEATASTRGAGKAAAGSASQPLPARTSAMLDETQ